MRQEVLRAVLYARCSTEEESQKNALIRQEKEARDCIRAQGWILADTYVESRSGTTSKNRSEYQRLFQDLEGGAFEVIVIKSQDRLMRNTRDWYLFLDRMQKNGKYLYLYLERKFYTPEDSLITGIKSILAEEYSRELSRKMNHAHRNRQREGIHFVFTGSTYGFRRNPDKSIAIDEEEAEMIRLAFRLSAEGCGTHISARILYEQGYRNRKGEKIAPSVLRKLIRNPLYMGTVVQNRQHFHFETKQMIRNPEGEWIRHEHAVPAIVEEELFVRANEAMDRRREKGASGCVHETYSKAGQTYLSGKVVCGLCGRTFYRTLRKRDQEQLVTWKCSNYLQNGRGREKRKRQQDSGQDRPELPGCSNVHLDERKLFAILERLGGAKEQAFEGDEELGEEILGLLQRVLSDDGNGRKRERLEERKQKLLRQKTVLLEKLLEGVVTDEDYRLKSEAFQTELLDIREKLRQMEADPFREQESGQRLCRIRTRLEGEILARVRLEKRLENLQEIRVFPDSLELTLVPSACPDLLSSDLQVLSVRGERDQRTVIRIPQLCDASLKAAKEEEKREILGYMKETPQITAAQIAARMEKTTGLINRRIRELRIEGRLRYSTPNGRGYWILCGENESFSKI